MLNIIKQLRQPSAPLTSKLVSKTYYHSESKVLLQLCANKTKFTANQHRASYQYYNIYRTMNSAGITSRRLQDKVAVVTASTDGIGFAIAKRLAQEGAHVVVSSRKQENVDKAVSELHKLNLNVLGLKCHVGDAADRKKLFEETIRKYGKLNILVSNAGMNPVVGGVLDCDEKVWDKIFDINVKSAYLLAKEALPLLSKEKGSNIVFVSSIAGYDAFDLLGAYSVSKTALIGLSRAAAKQLAPQGIRVNCLAPGIIKTKFSKALHEHESSQDEILSRIPLYRFGTSDEMGGIVAFLVSEDASYITGETILASGGMPGRL